MAPNRIHRRKRSKRSRTRELPPDTEASLVALLVRQGCTVLQSPELDNVFKIDALIIAIRKGPKDVMSVGLQITRSRDREEKLDIFLREAAKWPDIGPRVYVEIRKGVTISAAVAVRDFMLKIWTDPKRGAPGCAWKIIVYPNGGVIERRLA